MIKLYNTRTHTKQDFKSIKKNVVKMYTCGLTVYDNPHIGNWAGYIYWDCLIRLLNFRGYKVERTQNITDVGHLTSDKDTGEDKVELRAQKNKVTAWQIAEKYENIAFHEGYDILGLLQPTNLVKATDTIEAQIELAKKIEKAGFTYMIEGDGLYFDTSKFKEYGEMANIHLVSLKEGARVKNTRKRNITDFAIWKLTPKGKKRDMEWNSPWGVGFPGWHLECSAIALLTLGEQIDIHTGGIDHIPVHHINEIAQTESVTGKRFANFWLHNNHLKVNGEKMSKSKGNTYTLSDILNKGFPPDAYKMFILGKHYRTEGNFTWGNLTSSFNRLQHWRKIACLRHQILNNEEGLGQEFFYATISAFLECLEDDLNTVGAISCVDKAFSNIDKISIKRIHRESFVELLNIIDSLCGFNLISSTPDINEDAKKMIISRSFARKRGNWGEADAIRDNLEKQYNILLNDTLDATIWWYAS